MKSLPSPEVRSQCVDELLDGKGTLLFCLALPFEDMHSQVVLQEFCHQAGRRSPDRRDELKDLLARALLVKAPLDGGDLSGDASNPKENLVLVSAEMGHQSPILGYGIRVIPFSDRCTCTTLRCRVPRSGEAPAR
jgi:hypothetical protein